MRKPRNIVYSSTPKTVRVNLDNTNPNIATWNNWKSGDSTKVLYDTTGAVTTIKFVEVDSIVITFDTGYITHAVNDPDFPDGVLNTTGYTALSDTKGFEIRGLNPSKTYTFSLATYPNTFDITYGRTNHVLNGVTKVALNTTDAIYKNVFSGVNPSAGGVVTLTVGGIDSSNYGFLSAMIIQEN